MRLLRIALSVRTSNAEAPRNMYISMAIREFHERVHKMALAVYTQWDIYRCFVFDRRLKFSQDFITSNPKRKVNAFSKCLD